MKKIVVISFLLLFTTLLFTTQIFSQEAEQAKWVKGELIIQLSSKAAKAYSVNSKTNITATGTGIVELDKLNSSYSVKTIEPLLKFPPPNKMLAEKYGLTRTYILRFSKGADISDMVSAYNSLEEITFAQPNGIGKIDHVPYVPNDTLYERQWGLHNTGQAELYPNGPYGYEDPVGTPGVDINLELAWDIHTGDDSVILAIIDTGVEYDHPEFAGRIVAGYDFVNDDADPTDVDRHGTECAGIAAAAGDNELGIAGVNWHSKIMPIKVLEQGVGSAELFAQGIIWAADHGADVLSMSFSTPEDNKVLEAAVNYAYDMGCVLVAARGNYKFADPVGSPTSLRYPASYDNVIAVGAMDPCDERKTKDSCDGDDEWESRYGADLDVMAPGTLIYTTDLIGHKGSWQDYSPSGDYFWGFHGTSAACPHVAGVASLLRSYDPSLTNAEIRTRLRETAVDMNTPGFDNETGYGRINAYAALAASIPKALFTGSPTIGDASLTVNFADTSTGRVFTSWQWDFDNDGTWDSNEQNPTYTYYTTGTYSVKLRVSNDDTSSTIIKANYISVYDFADDFADGNVSYWDVIEGDWSVVSGQYDVTHTGWAYSLAPMDVMGEGTITTYWTSLADGRYKHGMVIFGWIDKNNYRYIDMRNGANRWNIKECVNGTHSRLALTRETINTGQQYAVKLVVAASGLVILYVDDDMKVSYKFSDVQTGKVGLGVQSAHSQFDNFFVTLGTTPISFCDDFEDAVASDWDVIKGDWSVVSGQYDVTHTGWAYSLEPMDVMGEGTITTDWTSLADGNHKHGMVIFGWIDKNNYRYIDMRNGANRWNIKECVNGTHSRLALTRETINTGQQYAVEVVVAASGLVTLYVDDDEKVSYQFSDVQTGRVGLGADAAHSKFDNFCVNN